MQEEGFLYSADCPSRPGNSVPAICNAAQKSGADHRKGLSSAKKSNRLENSWSPSPPQQNDANIEDKGGLNHALLPRKMESVFFRSGTGSPLICRAELSRRGADLEGKTDVLEIRTVPDQPCHRHGATEAQSSKMQSSSHSPKQKEITMLAPNWIKPNRLLATRRNWERLCFCFLFPVSYFLKSSCPWRDELHVKPRKISGRG